MTPGTQWTPREINYVRERHMAGDSDPMIARELGRKPDGVRYIREKMGISRYVKALRMTSVPFEDGYRGCLYHLIDLMREYGSEGCTLAEAKAEYRAANDLDVPDGYQPRMVIPYADHRSWVGSTAAMCAD